MLHISAEREAQGEHPFSSNRKGRKRKDPNVGHQVFSLRKAHTASRIPWVTLYFPTSLAISCWQKHRQKDAGFLAKKRRGQTRNKSRDVAGVLSIRKLSRSKRSSPAHPRQQAVHLRRCRAKPKFSFPVAVGKQKGKKPQGRRQPMAIFRPQKVTKQQQKTAALPCPPPRRCLLSAV